MTSATFLGFSLLKHTVSYIHYREARHSYNLCQLYRRVPRQSHHFPQAPIAVSSIGFLVITERFSVIKKLMGTGKRVMIKSYTSVHKGS